MNDQQENGLSHYEKVTAWLANNQTQLAATPAITATLQPQLDALNKKIRDDDEHAVQDNTGYGDNKQDIEQKLELIADHVGSGLESYADDADDFVLMNSVEFTLSQIQGFRDNRLLQYAQFVYSKATDKNIQPVLMQNHNIKQEDLDTLGKLIKEYEAALPLLQQMKGESVAWGKQVDRDLAEASKIMVRIRRKMNTYRTTNVLLFDTFQAVDTVDDTGSHKSRDESINAGETVVAEAINYKADMLVTLESTGATTLSFQLYDKKIAVGKKLTVDPGNKLTTTLGDMAPSGDELRVTNEDITNTGSYRVS